MVAGTPAGQAEAVAGGSSGGGDNLTLGGAQAAVLNHGTSVGNPAVAGLKRYLSLFLHRYLEFRLPEVEALASMIAGGLARWVGCVCLARLRLWSSL